MPRYCSLFDDALSLRSILRALRYQPFCHRLIKRFLLFLVNRLSGHERLARGKRSHGAMWEADDRAGLPGIKSEAKRGQGEKTRSTLDDNRRCDLQPSEQSRPEGKILKLVFVGLVRSLVRVLALTSTTSKLVSSHLFPQRLAHACSRPHRPTGTS